ncbi:ACP S-malonyltransferase [Bacillaceae bacterium]
MGKFAFVFPGQGSQYVGMGKEICEKDPRAKEIFAMADETLGFSLSTLCFEGPERDLQLTVNTQPAILTVSVALLAALGERRKVKPDFVAGHSLGEYSALVAAGAITFSDAVRTVRLRGRFMEEAVPAGKGAMAAVLGMERETLSEICERVTKSGAAVELANLNCPGQIVISGTAEGVAKAGETAKEQGAKRVLPLKVSGPFHSSLMAPAADKLSEVLEGIQLNDGEIPVVANAYAKPLQRKEELRKCLVEQVTSPVLWEDSIRWMIAQGVDTFVEIGPGTVLTGLIRKIDRGVTVYNVEDSESLEKVADALA